MDNISMGYFDTVLFAVVSLGRVKSRCPEEDIEKDAGYLGVTVE